MFQKVVGILFLGIFLASCGNPGSESSSQLQGLGYDGYNNVALLFGSPNGLDGVPTDIREMKAMFEDPENNFLFKVITNDKADKNTILSMSKENSKTADSLYWYFSGHGNDGILAPEGDGTITFKEVKAEIQSVRQKPFKRLIVMLDSCLSGSFVDGGSSIVDDNAKLNLEPMYKELDEAYKQKFFDQAFVFASSKKDENSSDLGADKGGAFTYALRMELADLRKNNPEARFQDLADKTIPRTKKEGGHTPVYKAFPSEDVMNDYLFLYYVR